MTHPHIAGEEMAFRYGESCEYIECKDDKGGMALVCDRILHCTSVCMFSNEHGIEPSGTINNGEFIDYLSDS